MGQACQIQGIFPTTQMTAEGACEAGMLGGGIAAGATGGPVCLGCPPKVMSWAVLGLLCVLGPLGEGSDIADFSGVTSKIVPWSMLGVRPRNTCIQT